MSILLWFKEITLLLLIGDSCNAQNCTIISNCKMVCYSKGPTYDCKNSGLTEVPSFPETTLELYVVIICRTNCYMLYIICHFIQHIKTQCHKKTTIAKHVKLLVRLLNRIDIIIKNIQTSKFELH